MTPNQPTSNQPDPNQPPRNSLDFGASFGALALIALGVIFFLNNLGFIPNVRPFWPLWMSAWGVVLLARTRNPPCSIWGLTLIAVGVLVTAGNLHYIHATMGNIWPVWLIAAGVSMLFKRNGWCGPGGGWGGYGGEWRRRSRYDRDGAQDFAGKYFGNRLHQNAAFASVNHRVDSPTFEGADLNATFGELKLDLRGATISTPDRKAYIETNASFGAIKLRVPETWKVVIEGSAVFGAFEDKTVPPRPVAGVDPPTLILRGNAAFGAVEIEN